MYWLQIGVAAVLLILFTGQVIIIRQKITHLSLMLTILSLAFVGYSVLLIPQVDVWINEASGGAPVTSLLKNFILPFPAIAGVLSWSLWGVNRRWQYVALVVIAGQMMFSLWSWEQSRSVCHQRDRFFAECALSHPAGAWAMILSFIVLVTVGLVTVWLLRCALGWRTLMQQSVTLLAATVILGSVWCLVSAVGVWELLTLGSYSSVQRAIRPPLAITVALIGVMTSLWLPLGRFITSVYFSWQMRHLMSAVGVPWWMFICMAGTRSESLAMDALSDFFTTSKISTIAVDYNPDNSRVVLRALEGSVSEIDIEIPALAGVDVQHRWLTGTAKVMA